ncbi:recombinase family protein [Francisella sp. XLW-1]|uniref:recombinase family protein n=1 Tax=Francisella sp. XLW-1 TaxID=2610887 RepID=UPI00123CCF53|nr:recombinase family protein [Francisella sp. XLW-1]
MAKVGYARVSSIGQKLDIQIEKLKAYGCTKIYQEKISGVDQNRPELIKCLDYVRDSDDTLVVTKLDRMARSALHLGKIVEHLQSKKVNLVVLDQNIDTTSIYGKLTFQILASVAEFENEIRKERQKEGIQRAQKDGKKFGRPRKVTAEIIEKVLEDSKTKTVSQILKDNNISQRTYYKIKNGKYNG